MNIEEVNEMFGFNYQTKKVETNGYTHIVLDVDVDKVNAWTLLALMEYITIKRNWITQDSIEVFELVDERITKQ